MTNLPAPTFNQQDTARPIPNLDPALLTDIYTLLRINFAFRAGDLFILTLNSTVLGGTYNQSFNVAQDTSFLELLIPTRFVLASAGTTVTLMARVQRGGITTYAPNTPVNINRLPIVVPPPTTTWDFDDGTFQGWVPQGFYAGGLARVINQQVVVNLLSSPGGKSHIITRAVPVVAGRTYDCHFAVSGDTQDTSVVHMTINGARIGPDVRNFRTGFTQTGDGTFTAATTGDVRLGIFNDAVPSGINRFSLDNIVMTPRP